VLEVTKRQQKKRQPLKARVGSAPQKTTCAINATLSKEKCGRKVKTRQWGEQRGGAAITKIKTLAIEN
jgi:hypothetical protein